MTATSNTRAHIGGEEATRALAVIAAMVSGRTSGDEASDGPGEPVIAAADLEAIADEECDREERWLQRDNRRSRR
jgi:hypothetical protein